MNKESESESEVQHSYTESTTAHGSTTQLHREHNSTWQSSTVSYAANQHIRTTHVNTINKIVETIRYVLFIARVSSF